MSTPFHFVVFLRSFLIGEARLPLYAVKKLKHFNNIYQLSTACYCSYINYGSRPSETLGSELEIMQGMAKLKAREPCAAGSPPQFHQVSGAFFSRSLCCRSPPSCSLEQASKHWKSNQARIVSSCFMAALLP